MTTNDQISDEKLQYDINREVAKKSSLPLSKIDKYECLTAEEVLPSNQKQIMEQAKFNYSTLGKAFGKQIKTIEDQGEKLVEALNTLKAIKAYKSNDNEKSSKHKEIFDKLSIEKIAEINISKEIDFNNLTYHFKDLTID